MDSYQAKIGWKRMRKSENKNYRSVPFLPDAKKKFPKQDGRGREKQKIKIIDTFSCYLALNSKLKKIAKKFKK